MDYLTTAQAAQRAKISRFALGRAAKSGFLHPIRDNRGALRWDPSEIDAWAGVRAAQGAHSERAQDSAQVSAQAAQAEIADLRGLLADAERRASAAETRAAVAEARLVEVERLAAERAERIEDLRRMLPPAEAPRRRRWWWSRRDE